MRKTSHRDYLRITMGVIITLILGGFLIPFMRLLPSPAFMGVALAPIYTISSYLTLEAVSIRHGIVLFAALLGLILSMFMPYIFFVTITPALIATLFFRKSASKAIVFASLQFNLMLPVVMPINSEHFYTFSILGFVVSIILSLLGLRLAKYIKPRVQPTTKRL